MMAGERLNRHTRSRHHAVRCPAFAALTLVGSMLSLGPDMASLAAGSVNFPTIVYENPPDFVRSLGLTMRGLGIKPRARGLDDLPGCSMPARWRYRLGRARRPGSGRSANAPGPPRPEAPAG